MSRAPRRRVLLALGLAAFLPLACLSPTLPLPPPGEPETIEGPDHNGNVRLAGRVPPHGTAQALNRSTQTGTFQHTGADGRYDFPIPAQPGDQILLWYRLEGEDSGTISFEIPIPAP